MDLFHVLAFLGGTVAGFALAVLIGRLLGLRPAIVLPQPTMGKPSCAAGQIQVTGSVTSPTSDGLTFSRLYAYAYTGTSSNLAGTPPSGSAVSASPFPISVPAVGTSGNVAIWVEYHAFTTPISAPYTCTSGSSSTGAAPRVHAAVAEQFEAVPRAYRVSPGSPLAGGGGAPAADVVGALVREPEAVLEYAPEDSTPVAPVWQARGGPGPVARWTLSLLHRHTGVGAVLSAACVLDGREALFTWVTSNWQFHATNRLTSEASDPGVPALLVRPA